MYGHYALAYLEKVVEPTKAGFSSIVAAIEHIYLINNTVRSGSARLLYDWLCDTEFDERFRVDNIEPNGLAGIPGAIATRWRLLASSEYLGPELERWTDAKRAAYFVRELYGEYTQEWHPRYDDLGVTISERWTDRARAEEFVGVLRRDQQEEDSRMQTYNAEHGTAGHEDGVYVHDY